ncbi:hypothetical protein AU476_16880 [Cupriavidus sp. UYMSc13B]|nr:hypothetical protein AU476_16880 [Cupriavidus sp. UYMSc13B]
MRAGRDATGKGNIQFTVSIGVSDLSVDGTDNLDTMLQVADRRLYAAKAPAATGWSAMIASRSPPARTDSRCMHLLQGQHHCQLKELPERK